MLLEWTFDKGTAGFVANQKVKISREIMDKDYFLVCQSCQTASTPGIRLTDVVLPVSSNEYCMEVDGFANNTKSFLWVKSEDGYRLIQPYVCLPELTKKIKPTIAPFRISKGIMDKETGQLKKHQNITIGVLIGGDVQPTINDMFFVRKIKIYERPLSLNHTVLEAPQITRIYLSQKQLEEEVPPKRDNGTLMDPGEYALIKCTDITTNPADKIDSDVGESNGRLYISYMDYDNGINKNHGDSIGALNSSQAPLSGAAVTWTRENGGVVRLRYLCNILEKENIFTQAMQIMNDKIIPIYNDSIKANIDSKNPKSFYDLNGNTQRIDSIKKGETICLYLDENGYVRWTRSISGVDL